MQASEIITDVRRELLEPQPGFWSDAELLRQINRAELDFVNRTRILEDSAFLTTSIGRADYPLPSNWLSAKLVIINSKNSDTDDDSWQRVYPTTLEKTAQETPNFLNTDANHRGTPRKYHIWGETLYLYPTRNVSVSGDLYLFYKSKPITLTDSSQSLNVDDSLAEGITAYVLWKAWSKSKETSLADEQREIYAGYVREGRRWAKRRSGDQRNKIDIESSIGFVDRPSFTD